jgi:hypothetical protein
MRHINEKLSQPGKTEELAREDGIFSVCIKNDALHHLPEFGISSYEIISQNGSPYSDTSISPIGSDGIGTLMQSPCVGVIGVLDCFADYPLQAAFTSVQKTVIFGYQIEIQKKKTYATGSMAKSSVD